MEIQNLFKLKKKSSLIRLSMSFKININTFYYFSINSEMYLLNFVINV